MYSILIIILLLVNIPVYKWIYRSIFKDSDDFRESVEYSITPDIFSLFQGRFLKDWLGEAKLSFFVISCTLVTGVEMAVLNAIYRAFV